MTPAQLAVEVIWANRLLAKLREHKTAIVLASELPREEQERAFNEGRSFANEDGKYIVLAAPLRRDVRDEARARILAPGEPPLPEGWPHRRSDGTIEATEDPENGPYCSACGHYHYGMC